MTTRLYTYKSSPRREPARRVTPARRLGSLLDCAYRLGTSDGKRRATYSRKMFGANTRRGVVHQAQSESGAHLPRRSFTIRGSDQLQHGEQEKTTKMEKKLREVSARRRRRRRSPVASPPASDWKRTLLIKPQSISILFQLFNRQRLIWSVH